MDRLATVDLSGHIRNSVSAVFQKMLSFEPELFSMESAVPINAEWIVGSVSFKGDVSGNINIHVDGAFARLMTATMLGIDMEEADSQGEIEDVIGELSNMIGGDIKSRFCDMGLPCEVSVPCVTRGRDFQLESMNSARHECLGIRLKQHTALVEVYIKSAS